VAFRAAVNPSLGRTRRKAKHCDEVAKRGRMGHAGGCRMPRPRIPEALLGGASCESNKNTSKLIAFEVSSKRRKGFPSESRVKRGDRVGVVSMTALRAFRLRHPN
jgi:hypothetical protein